MSGHRGCCGFAHLYHSGNLELAAIDNAALITWLTRLTCT